MCTQVLEQIVLVTGIEMEYKLLKWSITMMI